MKETKTDKSAKDGIAAKPFAKLFEIWITKRESGERKGRLFHNDADRNTAVYIANKLAEVRR